MPFFHVFSPTRCVFRRIFNRRLRILIDNLSICLAYTRKTRLKISKSIFTTKKSTQNSRKIFINSSYNHLLSKKISSLYLLPSARNNIFKFRPKSSFFAISEALRFSSL